MITFADYFSDNKIIDLLVKYRIQLAIRRNKFCHYNKHKTAIYSSDFLQFGISLVEIFPPRKYWKRPSRRDRSKLFCTSQINSVALKNTIKSTANSKLSAPDWYKKLMKFVEEIRNKALYNNNFSLNKPDIYILSKKNKFRVLSIYEIKDRVILNLTSEYFRDICDPFLKPCNFAHRNPKSKLSFEVAAQNVIDYVNNTRQNRLYVAQLDIRRYTDLLSHKLVQKAFSNFLDKAYNSDISINKNAIKIFYSLLNSYSLETLFSNKNCPVINNIIDFCNIFGIVNPDKERIKGVYRNEKLGLPTGTFFSVLAGNIVLDELDCIANTHFKDLLYLRYIDDITILSKNKKKCEDLLACLTNKLSEMNCLIHAMPEKISYCNNYFFQKTKPVHKWLYNYKKALNTVPAIHVYGYKIPFPKRLSNEELERINKVLEALE